MIKVTEARLADFEEVLLLYQKLNPEIDKSIWQETFFDHFNTSDTPGYVLKDDEKIVGFFGTIFSVRNINGQQVRFCNCHSWIVDENYRSKGLLLLNRLNKLKDCIVTNFSASPGPYEIMKTLKWKEVDNAHTIFFSSPLKWLYMSTKGVLKGNEMLGELSGEERKIAEDHKKFRCALNVVKKGDDRSFQVYKSMEYFPAKINVVKNYSPVKFHLGHLYYLSNPDFFFGDFKNNLHSVCKKEKWIGLVVPNRFVKNFRLTGGKRYYHRRPVLVKTNKEFDVDRLDLLYSEIFVLDLK